MKDERRSWREIWLRPLSKPVVAFVGGILMVAGVVMLVVPGPGLVTIVLGLAVLGREFHWARRLNARLRERVEQAAERAKERLKRR